MNELVESVFEGPDEPVVKPKIKSKKIKEPLEAKEKVAGKKAFLKKLEPDTAKLLSVLRDKANKIELGRKVRDNELLHLGLTLIESGHIEALKESTYSEQDRLTLAHTEYQKAHGKMSLDQFIGKLLRGEIRADRNSL
jgi:hypothetical protein